MNELGASINKPMYDKYHIGVDLNSGWYECLVGSYKCMF